MCYAIRKQDGFKYLEGKGVNGPDKETFGELVMANQMGEVNMGKSFLVDRPTNGRITNQNSYKQRAILFKHSLVRKNTRKQLDEGMKIYNYKVYSSQANLKNSIIIKFIIIISCPHLTQMIYVNACNFFS
jgi:hypothetical protein